MFLTNGMLVALVQLEFLKVDLDHSSTMGQRLGTILERSPNFAKVLAMMLETGIVIRPTQRAPCQLPFASFCSPDSHHDLNLVFVHKASECRGLFWLEVFFFRVKSLGQT